MMHLKEYHDRTLCDLPVAELGEDEVSEPYEEMIESPPDDVCLVCLKEAERLTREANADARQWRDEIAREEGMLNGIDSYNDWREFLG
jgi:hypothetical protein